jgi:hypothetical protein
MKHFNRLTIPEFENIVIRHIDKLFILPVVVLIPMSIFAIALTQWSLFQSNFSFSIKGIEFYLISFSNFKLLFTATLAICTAYWGILNIKQKIKQDKLLEWKMSMDERLKEKESTDYVMCREIKQIRAKIFNSLYPLNFQIQNKKELKKIFDLHFPKTLVCNFETRNHRRKSFNGIYPSEDFNYSFKSFQFIFFVVIDKWYKELPKDLEKIYKDSLKDIHRKIDQKTYEEKIKEEKTAVNTRS